MHDKLIGPFFYSENTVLGHAGAVWGCLNYHLKPSSNKMGCRHISAMLGITWTERWLENGSAEVDQLLGQVARFNPIGFFVGLCEEHCLPG
jgi:hypothetical protein